MAQTQAEPLESLNHVLACHSDGAWDKIIMPCKRQDLKEKDANHTIHKWLVDWIPAKDQVLGNLPVPLI